MTKLDRVTCSADYTLVENEYSNLNYQSCDVPCHEECVGGCNKAHDARYCMECKHDKFYFSDSRFECIPTCGDMPVTQVEISGVVTDIQTGDITDNGLVPFGGLPVVKKAFIPAQGMCRLCHPECGFGCTGTSNRKCISPFTLDYSNHKGCLNVQVSNHASQCVTKYLS